MKGTLKGIGLFAMEIIHLISIGKTVSIEIIEKCIDQGNVIEYITSEFSEHFTVSFDGSLYDNQQLNAFFHSYSGAVNDNESRKLGVIGNDQGLLVLLALIAEIVETKSIEWSM